MTVVLIPAGEFLMGSPPTTSPERIAKTYHESVDWCKFEFPQHRVRITRPFWLGKFEVTQAQWEAATGSNPSRFADRPQNPVEKVSWRDCQAFVRKLSEKVGRTVRLPTEAQ